VIGNGVVVHVPSLFEEIKELEAKGVNVGCLGGGELWRGWGVGGGRDLRCGELCYAWVECLACFVLECLYICQSVTQCYICSNEIH
jgi:hypothetical protein